MRKRRDRQADKDLEERLKDNPLLRSTAEAVARDHGLTFEVAVRELLKVW